jgi:hypothetical protein
MNGLDTSLNDLLGLEDAWVRVFVVSETQQFLVGA